MTRPLATKDGADPELAPTGLVDPRAMHPGPDEVDEPGPQPDATPGPEDQPVEESASPPAGEAEAGTGIVDPRSGLPGPDLKP